MDVFTGESEVDRFERLLDDLQLTGKFHSVYILKFEICILRSLDITTCLQDCFTKNPKGFSFMYRYSKTLSFIEWKT